jgi:hypothetical protein
MAYDVPVPAVLLTSAGTQRRIVMATLWKRISETVDEGMAATMGAVKAAGEKAAETGHTAQMKYQRSVLDSRIMHKFGELGAKIYEKALREDVRNPIEDPEVRAMIEAIKPLDQELALHEARMEEEARQKPLRR